MEVEKNLCEEVVCFTQVTYSFTLKGSSIPKSQTYQAIQQPPDPSIKLAHNAPNQDLPNPYIMGNGSYKGTSSDNQLH
jgi:hypothetical protein